MTVRGILIRRRSGRARIAAGVLAAGLLPLCLLVLANPGQASAAAAPAPSGSAAQPVLTCPTVSPVVSASPAPTGVASLPPVATPTPVPLPTPGPGVSPTPAPVAGCDPGTLLVPVTGGPSPSAPSSSSGGPGTGSGGSSGSTGSSTAGGLFAFSPSLWGQWVSSNPSLAGRVAAILGNPLSQQPPDLHHFSVPAAASGTGPGGSSGAARLSGSQNTGINVADAVTVLTALAVVMALLALVAMVRWAGVMAVRSRMATLLPPAALVLTLTAAAAGVSLTAHPAPSTRPAAAALAPAQPAGAIRAAAATTPVSSSAQFSALVAIETTLAGERSQLIDDEAQIADTTHSLAQRTGSGSAAPAVSPSTANHASPNPVLGAAVQAVFVQGLGTIVADHQQLLAEYQQTLRAEYALFVTVAQSPAASGAVQSAAASMGPAIADSVNYDLNVVQTQLAQEAAITGASASAPAQASTSLSAAAQVTLHAPLSGVVTQPFGSSSFTMELPVVYGGVFYQHFHTGLDIAAPLDTPVGSAAAGRVIFAGQSRDAAGHLVGYGNYVMVEHASGLVTLYGHLDRILVAVGDTVQQGQPIGLEGSTGWSTGPHVHFEVRVNGKAVDPVPYLAAEIQRAATSSP